MKDKSIPDGVLPEEKMSAILLDIHTLEAQITNLNLKKDSSQKIYDYYERQLFNKHGINDSLYLISYNYYLFDLKKMTGIYENVVDSLSLKQRLAKGLDH